MKAGELPGAGREQRDVVREERPGRGLGGGRIEHRVRCRDRQGELPHMRYGSEHVGVVDRTAARQLGEAGGGEHASRST